MRFRVIELRKDFVLPPTQPNPNIPKIYAEIFVVDMNKTVEVWADWSNNAATRKTNLIAAVKTELDALNDGTKGEWDYNTLTGQITKVT